MNSHQPHIRIAHCGHEARASKICGWPGSLVTIHHNPSATRTIIRDCQVLSCITTPYPSNYQLIAASQFQQAGRTRYLVTYFKSWGKWLRTGTGKKLMFFLSVAVAIPTPGRTVLPMNRGSSLGNQATNAGCEPHVSMAHLIKYMVCEMILRTQKWEQPLGCEN